MVNYNFANRIHQIINHKTYNIFIPDIDVAMQACGQKLDNVINYYFCNFNITHINYYNV